VGLVGLLWTSGIGPFLPGSPSLASAGAAEEDCAAIYARGSDALSEARYREAAGLLEKAADCRPDDIELFYWLGVARWHREQGDESIQAYERAIELDPDGVSIWSLYALENLGEVATRTDRLEESKGAYRRALERETRPEWISKIRNQLVELDLTLGIYQPDDATVFNDRGEVIGGVGPGLMQTNRNFEIARHTNDPEKEARYYRLAIETDPAMYQSSFNLGLALTHLGRYGEAIPWLEESDRIWKADSDNNPERADKADAHAFLALCHLELGELEKARHHAERARLADPALFWVILYDLRVQVATGEAALALPLLQALADQNPDLAEVLFALSEAHAALGHREEAHLALTAAIESVPEKHPWMGRLTEKWERRLALAGSGP
jgi:tetratricopeptide (TPR) repeat protein